MFTVAIARTNKAVRWVKRVHQKMLMIFWGLIHARQGFSFEQFRFWWEERVARRYGKVDVIAFFVF